ncbi:MAG: hypothetical protein LBQ83_02890 [Candidatus Margulisbacteria bacterium]|nr:hypothetical protein [Candidatus Margulisiibacteriota bacterium]
MSKVLFLFCWTVLVWADFSGQIIRAGQWDNYGHEVRLIRPPAGAAEQDVFTAVTAVNGRFLFTGLPPGAYTLQVYNEQDRLLTAALEIPASDFFWKYAGPDKDGLSFAVLNLGLTALIFFSALLLWLKRPALKSRQIFGLAVSFTLYTGTDFLQNVLAWRGLEGLAGSLFFWKHIGSAWFGYLFYKFWADFGTVKQTRDFYWLLPLGESLILCTWPFFGLDAAFEKFWFFSFAFLRLVIMLQLVLFIAAGIWLVFRRKNQEKAVLFRSILTATQYVFVLLILLLLGLVLLPLLFRQGAEFFDQQYVLTALIFGVILFGWLASTEIYQQLWQAQLRLEQQERLSALGVLASGLAHEIKNPLAALSNIISLLPARYRQAEFRAEFMAIVPRQIDRINNLLTDLLSLSRPSAARKQTLWLERLLASSLVLLQAQARQQNVNIVTELAAGLKLCGEARRLEQVFLNLGLNALQAMPRGGTLTVRALRQGRQKIIIFQDTGGGIRPEILDRIFDPFFTTRKTGTGLGLSLSKKILDEHKIKIEIQPQPRRGTAVKLTF